MQIRWTVSRSTLTLAAVLCAAAALFAQAPGDAQKKVDRDAKKAAAEKKLDDQKRVSVEVARERAKLVQSIYSDSLDVIHRQYFHNRDDRTTIPARAMEDVFSRTARRERIQARWISVNTPPMNIDHKPQDGFEKQAVRAIVRGAQEYEAVEDGFYRRAVSISLMGGGCLRCHLQTGASGRIPRFAGLVVSIPVTTD